VATLKKVSAISSRRAVASATASRGPFTTIQLSLRWGRAATLERPLRVKVRHSASRAKLCAAKRSGASR
jgi:hypothetical protein